MMLVMILPMVVSAQSGPGTPGPGGSGGNPDAPLNNPVVPFNSTMNIIFLLAAVVFAVVMFKKMDARKEKC